MGNSTMVYKLKCFEVLNKKTFVLFLIFLVCSFETFVIYKIFTPNVSDEYKLYYIDKKLKYWTRGKSLDYKPGDLLDFKEISLYLSRNGWSNAENSFRWTDGSSSEIYIKIPTNNIKGILTLHIKTLGKQKIIVKICGIEIASKDVNSNNQIINFTFDPSLLKNNSVNIIHFDFPNAQKPGKGDQRLLAMALKSFKLM